MRLQDLRQRAQSRISTETDEEREVRLTGSTSACSEPFIN